MIRLSYLILLKPKYRGRRISIPMSIYGTMHILFRFWSWSSAYVFTFWKTVTFLCECHCEPQPHLLFYSLYMWVSLPQRILAINQNSHFGNLFMIIYYPAFLRLCRMDPCSELLYHCGIYKGML